MYGFNNGGLILGSLLNFRKFFTLAQITKMCQITDQKRHCSGAWLDLFLRFEPNWKHFEIEPPFVSRFCAQCAPLIILVRDRYENHEDPDLL